jgi:hypothetical protein
LVIGELEDWRLETSNWGIEGIRELIGMKEERRVLL